MDPIEFETELQGNATLALPPDVADRLPKSGRAKVWVRVQDDSEDQDWRLLAYEEFARDDAPEDAVYDGYQ